MLKYSLLFILSFSALAQEVSVKVLSPVKVGAYPLGIGTQVELKIKNKLKTALFLGKMVDQDKRSVDFLFLDEKQSRISLIDPENVGGFRKSGAQVIVKPIDQRGETCAAYGFFHFWNQTYAMNDKGNGELAKIYRDDRPRIQFMEEIIETYYVKERINITKLMKEWGARFGFTCKGKTFSDPAKAADYLFERTAQGKPVLMDYNIGPDMVLSQYEVIDFEKPLDPDSYLWVPRERGQRNSGGHAIVAAAAFVSKGKRKVLVLDSNWSDPRVWDLEKYFNPKVAIKEMGFHSCD